MNTVQKLCIIALVYFLAGCTSQKTIQQNVPATSSLKFLDEYVIPYDLKFNNTWVGGLSGIDYNKKNNQYYIISDERSATSPSRFYTASIKISNYKIDTVIFTAVYQLQRPDGSPFPPLKTDPVNAADPESIRYNPVKNNLIWSSEGDKAQRNGKMNIKDPSVYEMDILGNYQDSFHIPSLLHMKEGEAGPRVNGVFEGTTFDEAAKYLYVSVEEPLYEDGPRAGVDYSGAPVRIIKFDALTHKPLAQYAYPLDAVANQSKPETAFKINGVPEIYWIADNRFLVIERSFSTGVLQCTIKIYLADISQATDVSSMTGLHQRKDYTPVSKKLLLNMNDLGRYIDNVEGITFGPLLPNGKRSLILIADNNFQPFEKSQVFLLETDL